MSFIFQFFILLSLSWTAWAGPPSQNSLKPHGTWLREELVRLKFPKSFIEVSMDHYDPKSFDTVLRLNTIGFLSAADHMNHVTEKSVRRCSQFLEENRKAFSLAQKSYQVSPDVIAALLWIETRHGDDQGNFHILSVFLHLLQTNLPANKKELTRLAHEKNRKLKKFSRKKLDQLMAERTKKRSQWAREQLLALAEIHKRKQMDLRTLKGSFAGAFGLPQFIPSSYLAYAKPAKPKTSPDLYKIPDAIMSVAHYLKKHGWNEKKPNSKVKALMHYNQSRDYADSILAISKKVASLNHRHHNRNIASKKARISE